jgi:hypothetical protein
MPSSNIKNIDFKCFDLFQILKDFIVISALYIKFEFSVKVGFDFFFNCVKKKCLSNPINVSAYNFLLEAHINYKISP